MVEITSLDGHLDLLDEHTQLLGGWLRGIIAATDTCEASTATAAQTSVCWIEHTNAGHIRSTVITATALVQILLTTLQRTTLHIAECGQIRIVANHSAAQVVDQIVRIVLVVLCGEEKCQEIV